MWMGLAAYGMIGWQDGRRSCTYRFGRPAQPYATTPVSLHLAEHSFIIGRAIGRRLIKFGLGMLESTRWSRDSNTVVHTHTTSIRFVYLMNNIYQTVQYMACNDSLYVNSLEYPVV